MFPLISVGRKILAVIEVKVVEEMGCIPSVSQQALHRDMVLNSLGSATTVLPARMGHGVFFF